MNQFEIENQEINFFSYAIQMLSDTRNYPIFPLYLIAVLEISSSLPEHNKIYILKSLCTNKDASRASCQRVLYDCRIVDVVG